MIIRPSAIGACRQIGRRITQQRGLEFAPPEKEDARRHREHRRGRGRGGTREELEERRFAHSKLRDAKVLAAMAHELRRLGVPVDEAPDALHVEPAPPRPAVIETYDDHRMAMSFALVGLKAPGIAIRDPGCVAKTFPDFFARLERLR